MVITSRSNPKVISASALKDKKYRDETGCFLIEGTKLFCEAVRSGIKLTDVFCTEEQYGFCRNVLSEAEITVVADTVLEKISTEKSPQGIICVAKYLDKIHNINKIYTMEDFADGRRVMLLSSLRDPGNLGTVVRTASAFGVDLLILSSDCADIYNPRTVRAAMGTLFRQPISVVPDLPDTVKTLKEAGYAVYAAVLDDTSVCLDEMTVTKKTAFIIGNEGHGIAPEVIGAAGRNVYIPMMPGVESLNASAAAAVFMWQSMISEKAAQKSGNK